MQAFIVGVVSEGKTSQHNENRTKKANPPTEILEEVDGGFCAYAVGEEMCSDLSSLTVPRRLGSESSSRSRSVRSAVRSPTSAM